MYTNIEHNKRNEPLTLTQTYSQDKYLTYDNYKAIEVSRVKDIPKDYYGVMGVPISFIRKYCPEQFEIVGRTENLDLFGLKTRVYTSKECQDAYLNKFGKNGTYDLNCCAVVLKNDTLEAKYKRLLIKRKITE